MVVFAFRRLLNRTAVDSKQGKDLVFIRHLVYHRGIGELVSRLSQICYSAHAYVLMLMSLVILVPRALVLFGRRLKRLVFQVVLRGIHQYHASMARKYI